MTPKSKPFKFPMSRNELFCGFIFLPVFIIILPTLVALVAAFINPNIKSDTLMTVFYLVSFIIVFLLFRKFLKASFSDFLDSKFAAISSIISGYIGYYILANVIGVLLWLLNAGINPNDEAIFQQIRPDINTLFAMSVLLAPFVEETLFRGVIFGAIRSKNRAAAYIISFLLFAFYHLWEYFVAGFSGTGTFDFKLLLNILEYLPASLVLCWTYEKSSTIWTPIILHMLMNFLVITSVI